MAYAGMARHGKSSFNEGKAVRLLEQFLEQKDTIKTFFKENDRTPNYDGSMELVESDGTPVKKFIVQIKKCENLEPNQIGKNKGKYVYPMETNFLYYVKGKVTESPAIYFVVDIANERIFWLYLSDETLMNLDFEGKERISYPFDDADILTDIDTFSNQLNQIAIERNELFVYKTSEEIAEIQDALDYINGLLLNDFSAIKDQCLPNLWRFGLRHSKNYPISISANGKTQSTVDAVSFALYPQIKGKIDTGIREYRHTEGNVYDYIDMSGKARPMDYARNALSKILQHYFENRISEKHLPTIMLFEQLSNGVRSLNRMRGVEDGKCSVNELYNSYVLLIRYVQHVLANDSPNDQEAMMKKEILGAVDRGRVSFFDVFNYSSAVSVHYQQFCSQHSNEEGVGFGSVMLSIISMKHIRMFLMLAELKERGVEYFEHPWEYDYFGLLALEPSECLKQVNSICDKWFSELPAVYQEVYDNLFEKRKYRFKGRIEYRNECDDISGMPRWIITTARRYKSQDFSVTFNSSISNTIQEDDEEKGLVLLSTGRTLQDFLDRRMLFTDSIHCLLYQGVCEELGYECKGLCWSGMNYSLFV